jgi:arylsulfatase A
LFFTLLAAAGIRTAADLPSDGLDLSRAIKDPQSKIVRDTMYWHYPHYYETTTPVSAIRAGDWKLLEYFEGERRELFNLRDDPFESQDLTTSQPEKVAELSKQLMAWRNTVSAKMPRPNPQFRATGK